MNDTQLKNELTKYLKTVENDYFLSSVLGFFISIVIYTLLGYAFFFAYALLMYKLGSSSAPKIQLNFLYWVMYTICFVVAMLLGHLYTPKKDYYLGWRTKRHGVFNNPFTLRDDIDRAHFFLGFLIAIPNFVMGNCKTIWAYFTMNSTPYSPLLAVKIMRLAVHSGSFEDIEKLGYSKLVLSATINYMMKGKLIKFDEKNRCCKLTFKGEQLISSY